MEKNLKSQTKIIYIKYHGQPVTKKLNCLMGHIMYQIFKIILSISSKTMKLTHNPAIRIYTKNSKLNQIQY